MFIRAKTINNKPFYYLVENSRQDGKVRQRVLAYLGESNTIAGAIAELERRTERLKVYINQFTKTAQDIKIKAGEREFPRTRRNGWRGSFRYIGRYWSCIDSVQKWDKEIRELEQRLAKLRTYRSA